MQDNKSIEAGQILEARSVCDYNCIFTVEILERRGNFVTVNAMNQIKRMKVHTDSRGEFVYALGKYSMCPIFRAA